MSSALGCELLLLLKPPFLQLQSVRSRSCGVALVIAGLISCTLVSAPGLSDPRSSFPGRRVGTRGECSAWAHLVPRSVYGCRWAIRCPARSHGDAGPLSIHLKPDPSSGPSRIVPAPAGILVLRVARSRSHGVESFFQCASRPQSGNLSISSRRRSRRCQFASAQSESGGFFCRQGDRGSGAVWNVGAHRGDAVDVWPAEDQFWLAGPSAGAVSILSSCTEMAASRPRT